jgi:hypothetical protein
MQYHGWQVYYHLKLYKIIHIKQFVFLLAVNARLWQFKGGRGECGSLSSVKSMALFTTVRVTNVWVTVTNLLHDWVSNQLQDEQSSSLLAVRPMPPSILQIKQLLPIHVSLIVSIKRWKMGKQTTADKQHCLAWDLTVKYCVQNLKYREC